MRLFKSKYPKEITEEIDILKRIRDNSLTSNKKVILLAAVLRRMGFVIMSAGDGIQKGFRDGPHIDAESPEGSKLRSSKWPPGFTPEREARIREIGEFNLVYQVRLFELLQEFYETRQPPSFQSRLTIYDTGQYISNIVPQAVSIMTSPEYKNQRKKWLKESLAEMNAFAEFLITKL